ncbi:hypothetical protein LEP1GSC046_1109 [Leptospira kirschneri serovar Bim str. 1051]|uniref:Uncharacterized protein n=1 Tax=Leptospira kirschneri str. H1 TaxID=1049966 RepID=A0A0E2AZD3_9LEPT|nr:hypothetical protein LEP1GSC081_3132 [Leptospira kirschneri str. H1]EMJ92034.1 hypothetical protein LEP1GSC198_0463 [Leptospira kirschneri str. JB]EMN06251.1 hypothetical protein LEP1GSC046_1109 [Leptospira kirschneri serovar Bim str. 1051]
MVKKILRVDKTCRHFIFLFFIVDQKIYTFIKRKFKFFNVKNKEG